MVALVSADSLCPGDLFESPWGRYVFRGRRSGGRIALQAVGDPTTFVTPTPADLAASYTPAGRVEERCLTTAPAPASPSPIATEAAPDALGAPACPSVPPSSSGDAPAAAPDGPPPGAPKKPRRSKAAPAPEPEPAPFVRPDWMVGQWWLLPKSPPITPRRTLGALQPGTSIVTLPERETLVWQPCMTGGVDADGKWVPHCYFIYSSLDISLWCPACRTPRPAAVSGSTAPAVEVDNGSPDLAATVEPAPLPSPAPDPEPAAPPPAPAPAPLPRDLPRDNPREEIADMYSRSRATPFSKALAAQLAAPAPGPAQRTLAITPADLAAQRRAAEVAERKRLGFDREFWSERAGIREFWGEMPREEAEIAAYGDVADYLAAMEFRR